MTLKKSKKARRGVFGCDRRPKMMLYVEGATRLYWQAAGSHFGNPVDRVLGFLFCFFSLDGGVNGGAVTATDAAARHTMTLQEKAHKT